MEAKIISIIIMALTYVFTGTLDVQAQDKDKKKAHIKIMKEVDGKSTVIDTVIFADSDIELKELLESSIDIKKLEGDLKKLEDIHIAIDQEHLDSLSYKIKIMTDKLEIKMDEELEKKLDKLEKEIEVHIESIEGLEGIEHKIIEKMVVVGDGDEKVIMIKDGNVEVTENGDEEIKVVVETIGDNEQVTIIKDGKKIETKGTQVVVMQDKDIDMKSDAKFVIVDVMMDDEKGSESKMVIALSSLDDEEIEELRNNGIEVKKKELELDDFHFSGKGDKGKYELKFSTDSTKDIFVELFNEDGKSIFKDVDKSFDGSYKGALKVKSDGKYYLVVTQGKASAAFQLKIKSTK